MSLLMETKRMFLKFLNVRTEVRRRKKIIKEKKNSK